MFRNLKADEIDCRPAQVRNGKVSLLLYKDARCDQNILDESVGPFNWQRSHTRDNANCIVSIWDEKKEQWISKEDTGTESFTEKEKGLASDSFKRACFNWGIGRELYTAPRINIKLNDSEIDNNKMKPWIKFHVGTIEYIDKKIVALTILDSKNVVRFDYSGGVRCAKCNVIVADKQAEKTINECYGQVYCESCETEYKKFIQTDKGKKWLEKNKNK